MARIKTSEKADNIVLKLLKTNRSYGSIPKELKSMSFIISLGSIGIFATKFGHNAVPLLRMLQGGGGGDIYKTAHGDHT
jgi:hypothetical protein